MSFRLPVRLILLPLEMTLLVILTLDILLMKVSLMGVDLDRLLLDTLQLLLLLLLTTMIMIEDATLLILTIVNVIDMSHLRRQLVIRRLILTMPLLPRLDPGDTHQPRAHTMTIAMISAAAILPATPLPHRHQVPILLDAIKYRLNFFDYNPMYDLQIVCQFGEINLPFEAIAGINLGNEVGSATSPARGLAGRQDRQETDQEA